MTQPIRALVPSASFAVMSICAYSFGFVILIVAGCTSMLASAAPAASVSAFCVSGVKIALCFSELIGNDSKGAA